MIDDLSAHRRMRRCLLSIRDLDPVGVETRIRELDIEIDRLETLLPGDQTSAQSDHAEPRRAVRAA